MNIINRFIIRIKSAVIFRLKQLYYSMGGENSIYGISFFRRLSIFQINGTGNTVIVKSYLPKNVKIIVYGNNHKLIIEENVTFKSGVIWFEDSSCEICIGKGTTIENANLAVAENGTKLSIGQDCMFSTNIRISTTDSHSIINIKTGERTNYAKDIIIGNHVWLGYCANIHKGVCIGNNVVVAGHAVVTKSAPPNAMLAGIPAKVIKENITWNRYRI